VPVISAKRLPPTFLNMRLGIRVAKHQCDDLAGVGREQRRRKPQLR
jgi:hypothetical protein